MCNMNISSDLYFYLPIIPQAQSVPESSASGEFIRERSCLLKFTYMNLALYEFFINVLKNRQNKDVRVY